MSSNEWLVKLENSKRSSERSEILSEMYRLGIGAYDELLVEIGKSHDSTAFEAIRVLGLSGDSRTEQALLGMSGSVASPWEEVAINSALANCGSEAALDFLVGRLEAGKSDLRCSALYAIDLIGGPRAESIVLGAHGSGKHDLKGYASRLIAANGSSLSMNSMDKRYAYLLKHPPKIPSFPHELVLCLYFFHRMRRKEYSLPDRSYPGLDPEDWLVIEAIVGNGVLPQRFSRILATWKSRTPW